MTFFYLGGMYLNDAFDAEIDAAERPERPIPSGQVSARLIFHLGFGIPFLIPGLNLLLLSFAPVGATLYHVEKDKSTLPRNDLTS